MSVRVNSNGNGTYDVITLCDKGCGRRIEQPNITASNATSAAILGDERLSPEGWEGGICRACLLHASGWQADRFGHRSHGGRS